MFSTIRAKFPKIANSFSSYRNFLLSGPHCSIIAGYCVYEARARSIKVVKQIEESQLKNRRKYTRKEIDDEFSDEINGAIFEGLFAGLVKGLLFPISPVFSGLKYFADREIDRIVSK